MSRKNKSLIVLIIIFILVTAAGGIFTLAVQQKKLKERDSKLAKLKVNYESEAALKIKLLDLKERVSVIDSILFTGKFTIPQNLPQSNFYNFVDAYSNDNSLYTYTNTEYASENAENGFNYYTYKVSGVGSFDNIYGLIYSIEHSRELKKIESADLATTTSVDSRGVPHYLVKFTLEVKTYFSYSDQYAAISKSENNLNTQNLYNAFYPLVRTEIRPNSSNLPDIQDGALISLVPQGAFVQDNKGVTHLLKKGDPVYLGYLTDIDYDNETVTFVLNKGGIIEYTTLALGKKHNKEGK